MAVKRILQVVGRMNRGGAESLLMELFRNIDRNEIMFDFMVHTEEECAYDEEIQRLGGRIYHVPRFTGVNFIPYVKAWKLFFNEHDEYKIVHGHIGSSAAIYLAIAKNNGCYTIAHSHNTTSKYEKGFKSIIYQCFSYPTRYIADYFFGCSKEAGLDRYGKKKCNSNNFSVLHNGIDVSKFAFNKDIREKLRMSYHLDNRFIVGVAGRITEQKNPFFIIEIFHEIKKLNKNAFLLWCGDGELRGGIEQKIKEYRLENDIELVGAVSNVNEFMQAFDIFLFPSLWEGLSISLIEAQTASLPCFISDVLSQEGDLTNLIHRISLKKSANEWAKIILSESNSDRCNQSDIIKKNSYDIDSSVNMIRNFYLDVLKNIGNLSC